MMVFFRSTTTTNRYLKVTWRDFDYLLNYTAGATPTTVLSIATATATSDYEDIDFTLTPRVIDGEHMISYLRKRMNPVLPVVYDYILLVATGCVN
jgi:uncharacterized protein (DUF2344 family)